MLLLCSECVLVLLLLLLCGVDEWLIVLRLWWLLRRVKGLVLLLLLLLLRGVDEGSLEMLMLLLLLLLRGVKGLVLLLLLCSSKVLKWYEEVRRYETAFGKDLYALLSSSVMVFIKTKTNLSE